MIQTRRDVLASIGTLATVGLGIQQVLGKSNANTDHDKSDKMGMRSDNGSDGLYGGVMWTNRPGGNPTKVVVDDDTLYLGATTIATEWRTNGKIVAYDRTTGAIKWAHSGIGSVDEALAVANETIYVAADGVTWHDHPHEDSGKPVSLHLTLTPAKYNGGTTRQKRGV